MVKPFDSTPELLCLFQSADRRQISSAPTTCVCRALSSVTDTITAATAATRLSCVVRLSRIITCTLRWPTGVVLKRSGGRLKQDLDKDVLNNLGLHTRTLIHVRKIATTDLWSCPAIQLLVFECL